MKDPAVTVAVVSWNTRSLLADCLRSLWSSVEAGRAEVWVFDNASTDGSPEMVRESFPWARLVASSENLGFGAGVNEIARRTATPWIAPANADISLAPDALSILLEEGARHPEAGAIAPRLILPDGSTQHSCYPFPTVPFTLAYLTGATGRSRRLARRWHIGPGFDGAHSQEVPWAVGAFLLVRRRAWDEVGGFDDAQWMYAEDLDLGWRLMKAGWRTRYSSRARVHHVEAAATNQAWGGARHLRWHASTYSWLARRRGLRYAQLLAVVNVVGFLLRAAILRTAGLAGNESARQAWPSAVEAARSHSVGLRPRGHLERVR